LLSILAEIAYGTKFTKPETRISQLDTHIAVSAQNCEGISHYLRAGSCPPPHPVQIPRLLIMQRYAISDPKFVQKASTPLLIQYWNIF
jgi:hypothetical protein